MSMHNSSMAMAYRCKAAIGLRQWPREPTQSRHPLMNPSFAQFRIPLLALVLICALGACASLPPPTQELAAAQQAVARADGADAAQHAADHLATARDALNRAQAAMAAGKEDDARRMALAAAAVADLAYATSREAVTRADLAQRQAEVDELRRRLQLEETP